MNTRDLFEIKHFKALSGQWWNEKGPFALLHEMTPQRIAFLKEKIGLHFSLSQKVLHPLKGLRILDVGCGGGILCEPLARLGAEMVGIDPVEENIEEAKIHAQEMELPIMYLPLAVEDLPENVPLFDVVIASEIVEHVTNPDAFLRACVARLKPHGGIFISTFNKTLKSYLFGILAAEYLLKWVPRGTHSWDKFISPQELSKKLKALGMDHQEIRGLQFSPLTRQWSVGGSTDMNYFLWAARQSKEDSSQKEWVQQPLV